MAFLSLTSARDPLLLRMALLLIVGFGLAGCMNTVSTTRPSHLDTNWRFAVSGDSRNCGNIVMPAIAAAARTDGARFYWHLGDLRAVYKIDEDYTREARFRDSSAAPNREDYLQTAWDDFTQHQVAPFGDMPFFIGIGNHETIPPKTRAEFLTTFHSLLDRPELRAQRASDASLWTMLGKTNEPRTYYHWVEHGVDFINLDNAVDNAFDADQLAWFDALVDADLRNPSILTLVVGMHELLPYSRADSHSMCASVSGRESGEHVYRKLAGVTASKRVYVLASHSHFYLANVMDTPHWRDPANGGVVLPGWIVGTAGAERYPLPSDVTIGPDAREHVYGYLEGTVQRDGEIRFDFHQLDEPALQQARTADYDTDDVAFCSAMNPEPSILVAKRSPAMACEDAIQH